MSYFFEFLLFIIFILFCFYKYATSKYDFFEIRNIPYEKPFLCFGNMKEMFFKTESMFYSLIKLHNKFNTQIYGIFEIRNPLIVIKDPELIKQITVKDFDHFVNHRSILDSEDDPLFGNSLFVLKDQKWKDMRATLTPAFTGSKMRLMFQLISECCDEAILHLKKQLKSNPNGIEMDFKDYFNRYTNDVIASSAFGLKINSLAEDDNQFFRMGKRATNFTGWVMIKFFLFSNFKSVMKFFKVQLFEKTFTNYFRTLVLDTMKYRNEHNIVRPDMITMLMEAQKLTTDADNNQKWSDDEIVAQCFLFFLAGFETTALLMCFAAHELMESPEIQKKLIAEIDETTNNLNGKPLTYEALQGMKYMDMIVSETMRKWPGAIAFDRVCTKPYILKTDDHNIQINVGDVLWINVAGLHYDENNFPNPNKFDPERFNEENKNNIKPYSYAPFGVGPRNCVGNRFALMEAKAILFHLLSHFTIEVSKNSTIPMELAPVAFQLRPKNGFWLKLCPRT